MLSMQAAQRVTQASEMEAEMEAMVTQEPHRTPED